MHYTCIVVLPPTEKDEEFPTLGRVQGLLEAALEPYNEEIETEEHKQRAVELTAALDAAHISVEFSTEVEPVWTPEVLGALAVYHGVEEEAVGFDGDGLFLIERGNPDGKWDWWVVGGRWIGFWKSKPGADCLLGESGSFSNAPEHNADVIRKGDIDFVAAREEAIARMSTLWDEMLAIPDSTKRKAFAVQNGIPDTLSREDALKLSVRYVEGVPHALLDQDGEWHASTDMWTRPDYQELLEESNRDKFRAVSRSLEDEWSDVVFPTLWKSIPDDAIVALVDYHS